MSDERPAPEPPRLPDELYRVVWDQRLGGHPNPRGAAERTQRTFAQLGDAARQVDIVEAQPDHHTLVGVYTTMTEWHDVTDRVRAAAETRREIRHEQEDRPDR